MVKWFLKGRICIELQGIGLVLRLLVNSANEASLRSVSAIGPGGNYETTRQSTESEVTRFDSHSQHGPSQRST